MNSSIIAPTLGVLFALLAVPLVVWMKIHSMQTARGMLEQWARENGYTLVGAERRRFLSGPFPLPFNAQYVFRIRALDAQRREISGWARASLIVKKKLEVRID